MGGFSFNFDSKQVRLILAMLLGVPLITAVVLLVVGTSMRRRELRIAGIVVGLTELGLLLLVAITAIVIRLTKM